MDFERVLALAAGGGGVDPTLLTAIVTGIFGIGGIVLGLRAGNKKADRIERRTLEAECRSLEDYANKLRGVLILAGITPPDWPAELRDGDPV